MGPLTRRQLFVALGLAAARGIGRKRRQLPPATAEAEAVRSSGLPSLTSTRAAASFGGPRGVTTPPWTVDVDGNGVVDGRDRALIVSALGSERGTGLLPARGYDYRADLLARGRVTGEDLALFDRLAAGPGVQGRRPIVISWHYGWYNDRRRFGEPTSVGYLGGPYVSADPDTEDRFNALKDEFGIGVDMLSWIDNPLVLDSYDAGYFSAASSPGRRYGWLYESAINLGSTRPMDFSPGAPFGFRLVRNFRDMALMMLEVAQREIGPDQFRVDGRPVIYLFASHLFGTSNHNLVFVADAIARARETFFKVSGVYPYLIGDESPFPGDAAVGDGRRFRATFFDAVTRYHHYDAGLVFSLAQGAPVEIRGAYLDAIVANERRTLDSFAGTRNRFTGAPLLVIPSSAAGFSKLRLPTLLASYEDYLLLLRTMQELIDEHLAADHADRIGTPALPAALVIAGSWNEEFEGHALFPSAFSGALQQPRFGGFDWLFALKAVYGWNRYRAGPGDTGTWEAPAPAPSGRPVSSCYDRAR